MADLSNGLIVHFKCNDNLATTNIIDSSGNGNNATSTVNTDTQSVTGKINNGLEFIPNEIATFSSLDVNNQDFTLSVWFKAGSVSGKQGIVGFEGSGGTRLRLNDTTIEWAFWDGDADAYLYSSTIVSIGVWYHVIVTRDTSSGMVLYVANTSEDSNSETGNPTASSLSDSLARFETNYYQGAIDDVRIYDRVITTEERALIYNSGNGTEDSSGPITNTVLQVHFDGADESTNFYDGSSNHLSISVGGGTVAVDTAQSKFGGASGLFGGSVSRLIIANNDLFDFGTGDFTFEAWIRTDDDVSSSTDVRRIVSRGNIDNTNGAWVFGYGHHTLWGSGTRLNFATRDGSIVDFSSDELTININTWYHVAVVRSSGTLYWFLDGVAKGTTACTKNISNDNEFWVGASAHSASEGFITWMDELRVSDNARWISDFTPETSAYLDAGVLPCTVDVVGKVQGTSNVISNVTVLKSGVRNLLSTITVVYTLSVKNITCRVTVFFTATTSNLASQVTVLKELTSNIVSRVNVLILDSKNLLCTIYPESGLSDKAIFSRVTVLKTTDTNLVSSVTVIFTDTSSDLVCRVNVLFISTTKNILSRITVLRENTHNLISRVTVLPTSSINLVCRLDVFYTPSQRNIIARVSVLQIGSSSLVARITTEVQYSNLICRLEIAPLIVFNNLLCRVTASGEIGYISELIYENNTLYAVTYTDPAKIVKINVGLNSYKCLICSIDVPGPALSNLIMQVTIAEGGQDSSTLVCRVGTGVETTALICTVTVYETTEFIEVYRFTSVKNATDIDINTIYNRVWVSGAEGQVIQADYSDLDVQAQIDTLVTNDLLTIASSEDIKYTYTSSDLSTGEEILIDETTATILNARMNFNKQNSYKLASAISFLPVAQLNSAFTFIGEVSSNLSSKITFLATAYDNINPLGREDFHVYIDSVEVDDVLLPSIKVTKSDEDYDQAYFELARYHDKLDYTLDSVLSEITNQNNVEIKYGTTTIFTGTIKRVNGTTSEKVLVTAESGEYGAILFNNIGLPYSSLNVDMGLYDVLNATVDVYNPVIPPEEEDPEYYAGIKIDLGTYTKERGWQILKGWGVTPRQAQDYIDGNLKFHPDYTYFFLGSAFHLQEGGFETGYMGTSPAVGSSDIWDLTNLYWLAQIQWENSEEEQGFYYRGEAPFKEVGARNGKYEAWTHNEDNADGKHTVRGDGYDYTEYVKQVAEIEYSKIKSINGDVLPLTKADITLSIDAYIYYSIYLNTRITIDNTTQANIYVNDNGFPVSVKSITISSKSMTCQLSTDNRLSQYEQDALDENHPDSDDEQWQIPGYDQLSGPHWIRGNWETAGEPLSFSDYDL